MLISHWYEDICDNSIPSHKQHQWNWTHYYTSRGLICYLLRTEWYSKTDHLGVSTAHNNGHKTLTRRGTKPQCLKIPKLFKSMLGLPNIWASKWEIGFMQMSTAKKTNECNHQCLWWDHHVCSLCSRGWVKLSCWKYVSALNALRCSPISESRLDAFSQRSGSKVQWWQLWIRNGSQVILPPLCCQIFADCPRATSAKLRNWCRVQPCRGFIWFSRGRTMSSSKNQNASSWSESSILLMRNLFWITRDVQL